jgi:hypothetical protein
LPVLGLRRGGELRSINRRRRQRFYFHGEKRRCKLAQLCNRRAAIGGEITQRLKIDHVSGRGRPIWVRRFEFVKGLSWFVVDG